MYIDVNNNDYSAINRALWVHFGWKIKFIETRYSVNYSVALYLLQKHLKSFCTNLFSLRDIDHYPARGTDCTRLCTYIIIHDR